VNFISEIPRVAPILESVERSSKGIRVFLARAVQRQIDRKRLPDAERIIAVDHRHAVRRKTAKRTDF
jgi:hypothetical protein